MGRAWRMANATVGQRPLDIHRHLVKRLDLHGQPRQLGRGRVVQHGRAAHLLRHGLLVRAYLGSHGHHLLVGRLALQHAAGRLGHGQRVGRHHAAHHRLAQAPCRADHDLIAAAGDRVGGEQDAGGLGRHEQLHDHRQRHALRRNPLARAIADGACRPQRRPALDRRVQHRVRAADVEVGLLLPGEGSLRQVFGGGGGADGNSRLRIRKLQTADWSARCRRTVSPRRFRRGRAPLQRAGGCGPRQTPARPGRPGWPLPARPGWRLQVVRRDKRPVGIGGHMKAAGHGQAGVCQAGEGGALAADGFKCSLRVVQWEHIWLDHCRPPFGATDGRSVEQKKRAMPRFLEKRSPALHPSSAAASRSAGW